MKRRLLKFDCDCSSREDVYRVAAKVQQEVGDVDILVNNAGIMSGKKLMNLKDVEIERTTLYENQHFGTLLDCKVISSKHAGEKQGSHCQHNITGRQFSCIQLD